MAKKGTRHKQRPTGVQYPFTPAWQAEVRKRLTARGSRAKLAKAIDCDPSNISAILKRGGSMQSRFVPAISKYLGIPMPGESAPEHAAALDELVKAGAKMSPENLKLFTALAKAAVESQENE